ncbi:MULTISPECIES: hypothetical protein [Acidithiobacillus]|uniref:Uncharacterized protein n=1 Tax=Acidithiobacillus ferruginosus TaxID=3063951 RepID=A0ACD5IFS5_9PROT|nr:hypothetical protein [Acidithiobacillus ferruginosus]MBU2814537.1 hypothetical protein [Acidithiobacillus ferruginosus]
MSLDNRLTLRITDTHLKRAIRELECSGKERSQPTQQFMKTGLLDLLLRQPFLLAIQESDEEVRATLTRVLSDGRCLEVPPLPAPADRPQPVLRPLAGSIIGGPTSKDLVEKPFLASPAIQLAPPPPERNGLASATDEATGNPAVRNSDSASLPQQTPSATSSRTQQKKTSESSESLRSKIAKARELQRLLGSGLQNQTPSNPED